MPYAKKSTTRRPLKRSAPYKRRARARAKVSPLIKTFVNKAIGRNIETKQVMYSGGITTFNSGIASDADFLPIIPPVSQGVTQVNRISDEIHPQKIVVRGYVVYDANNIQGANEIISRLFCFQDKSVKNWLLKSQVSLGLLDQGGTASNFTGTLINLVTPHNTDRFTWYKDVKHRFLKPFGYTNNSVVTTAITSMNGSLVWFFSFTLTKKHLPHTFKYDGADASYPNNSCPILSLGYGYAQNDSPDVLTGQIKMAYTSTLYYKDA